METAFARHTDPETSHMAAQSVNDLTLVKRHILHLLQRTPLIDEDLVVAYELSYELAGAPAATPQSIRSRRAELVKAGLVQFTGSLLKTRSGRSARVWAAA